jgi:protoporphyrinogen IX oxidase
MNSPTAWALVFHVVGFVFWMGGLMVATQVMAAESVEASAEARRALERLERVLFKGVAHPGAAITVIAGITVVAIQPAYLYQHWLHAKLTLVAVLIALDLMAWLRAREFHQGVRPLKRSFCKAIHGAIAATFLGIVILVMIKPF